MTHDPVNVLLRLPQTDCHDRRHETNQEADDVKHLRSVIAHLVYALGHLAGGRFQARHLTLILKGHSVGPRRLSRLCIVRGGSLKFGWPRAPRRRARLAARGGLACEYTAPREKAEQTKECGYPDCAEERERPKDSPPRRRPQARGHFIFGRHDATALKLKTLSSQ